MEQVGRKDLAVVLQEGPNWLLFHKVPLPQVQLAWQLQYGPHLKRDISRPLKLNQSLLTAYSRQDNLERAGQTPSDVQTAVNSGYRKVIAQIAIIALLLRRHLQLNNTRSRQCSGGRPGCRVSWRLLLTWPIR